MVGRFGSSRVDLVPGPAVSVARGVGADMEGLHERTVAPKLEVGGGDSDEGSLQRLLLMVFLVSLVA